jgi:hypothetical protein
MELDLHLEASPPRILALRVPEDADEGGFGLGVWVLGEGSKSYKTPLSALFGLLEFVSELLSYLFRGKCESKAVLNACSRRPKQLKQTKDCIQFGHTS